MAHYKRVCKLEQPGYSVCLGFFLKKFLFSFTHLFVIHMNFIDCCITIKVDKSDHLPCFHFFTSQKHTILIGVYKLFISIIHTVLIFKY